MAFQNYWTEVGWDLTLRNLGRDGEDLVIDGQKITSGAPTVTANRFSSGAIIINTADGTAYQNTGTTATPVWSLLDTASGSGINQLTGDVTAGPGVGSQAATIAANAVTTTKINNAAVTYAKIQDVTATNRLLGRSTAGAGDVEEITVGGDITQSGSNFNLGAGVVEQTNIAAGVQSVSRIVFDAVLTTAGGGNTETIAAAGVVATDRVQACFREQGSGTNMIHEVTAATDGVTFRFDADPGATTTVNVLVTRTIV